MKKTILLISITFSVLFVNAQNDMMYVMKNGSSVAEYNIATGVDSIIFYDPGTVTVDPPVGESVPFYDLTGKAFGLKSAVGTTASNWGGGWQDGPVKQYAYESSVVGGKVGLDVIFPPSYDSSPNKRYPVIYHLHGKGEDLAAYRYNGALNTKLPQWMNSGSIGEFIFISIGGPGSCWWSDGEDGTKAESHIVNEILSAVDQKFRTLGTQSGRAIMGFSMGGFGCHKIAIKYPQYFAVGAPYCGATYSSGYVNSASNPQGFGFAEYTTIWANDADYNSSDCGRNLLASKAAAINSNGTSFVIRCKTADLFTSHNRTFRDELNALGINNTFLEGPGGHDMNDVPAEFFTSILSYMDAAQ